MFFKNNKSNDKQISSDKINHKLDNVKDISFEKRCRDEQYQSLRDFNAELFVNAFTYNLAQNTGNTGRSDSGIYGSIIVDIDICKSINLHMIKSQSDFESRIIELQHNKESQNARFM
ncbi:MAG: hypothetical protein J5614_05070, partial [Paludibacteraceae bacterium]|nr:hypothetical protein [Paludibacteraceae bacterium]